MCVLLSFKYKGYKEICIHTDIVHLVHIFLEQRNALFNSSRVNLIFFKYALLSIYFFFSD